MRATVENKTYELDFSTFDESADQIIMDIRSGDITLYNLSLRPCNGCPEIDLLTTFGQTSLRMRYDFPFYYDVIFDFKRRPAALLDHSVFAGSETST